MFSTTKVTANGTVDLVVLSVSSALCVHQLSLWISEVTVAEFAVEAGCGSRVIATLLNVLQASTFIHSFIHQSHITQQLQHTLQIPNASMQQLQELPVLLNYYYFYHCYIFCFLFIQLTFHIHHGSCDPWKTSGYCWS